ncbi:MAG: ABC transporter ATP-binding protein [Alphaproteobacteria bacterium]
MSSTHSPVEVRIDDLSLSFGETEVLKGIDLVFEPGEFFSFLGPSGSGKSTLLRAIAGFGPIPGGSIRIDGEEVGRLPANQRNVGMVFQSYALWPHMTVRKNVAFGLEERRIPATEIRERVDEALDMVGLLDYAERRPSQLSGGQQQRVALARTIVVRPRVLLLDEPLSNLDANLRIQMRHEIHDLQRKLGLTTIFVTHDQEEANTMSDRIAVLNDGILQQVGAPMAMYDNPANLFVAGFLGTANVIPGTIKDGVFKADGGISVAVDATSTDDRALMFRPQNVILTAADAATLDNCARLDGTVAHVEFLGSIIRYIVQVGPHRVLVDEAHQSGVPPMDEGKAVALHLNLSQVVVLAG